MKNWTFIPEDLEDLRWYEEMFFIDWVDWGVGLSFSWFSGFRGFKIHLGPFQISLGVWKSFEKNK